MSRRGCGTRAGGPGAVTLALMGDLMTGRGIDQILPHPCDPRLHEPYVSSAKEYVEMTQRKSGPIPVPAPFAYVWGEARAELERLGPALRMGNLETAVTDRGRPARKSIHYRMNPRHLPVLSALGLDACSLANNHVLDWGVEGLRDTLHTLEEEAIPAAGAGVDEDRARAPAVLPLPDGRRVLFFARAHGSSGVPADWSAGVDRPGVALFPDLSAETARSFAREVDGARAPGDRVVLSLHWGPNWGYRVDAAERAFAHALVDEAGVDLIHGHSSHHPRPVEVYRGRLILYGCGDFLNDYEAIGGHEEYRPEVVLLHVASLSRGGGLARLEQIPFRVEAFRLVRASPEETSWLAGVLSRYGRDLGTGIRPRAEGGLEVRWEGGSH